MRRWPVVLAWLATRALVISWLTGSQEYVLGDVRYYADAFADWGHTGFGDALTEYPVPAVIALGVPYAALALFDATGIYVGVIVGLAVATDLALFSALLFPAGRARPSAGRACRDQHSPPSSLLGAWAWVSAVPLLGSTAFARFDLLPGVLMGLAILAFVHRPALAAALGSLATGVKYVPALMLPALAAPRSSRRRALTVVGGVGLTLALITVALGGWDRLFTPLTYQSDRGLQIESVAATPAMLAWAFGSGDYEVAYASSKAYEVTGPMTDPLLTVTTVATVVGAVGLLTLWVIAWRRIDRPADGVDALVWLTLASVGGFMVTSKVLSPQYLLWLLPAAAAGLTVLRGQLARPLLIWTALLLLATALTQHVFPRNYVDVTLAGQSEATVIVLAVRNLLLLGLVVYAVVASVRALRR